MKPWIVVPSYYQDLFDKWYVSLRKWEPDVNVLVVRSGDELIVPNGVKCVQGKEPFVYSRNVNIGWRETAPSDIILSGDDVTFLGPFVDRLQSLAYEERDPKIGLVVPEIIENAASIFVCCYIRRSLIDEIGYIDERFTEYGYDDNDYHRRLMGAGYQTLTTHDVKISHPLGGTSYMRKDWARGSSFMDGCKRMRALYEEKWNGQ